MESFGGYLQEARQKKNLSLQQVASQTRIQQKYLKALETEDFSSLPGKVFAKGFVRSYAKALGLNDDEALQRFLDASGNFYEQTHQEQQYREEKVQAEHRGKLNRNLVIGVCLLLAVGLFYFLPSQQESPETDSGPGLSSPEPVPPDQFPENIPSDSQEALPTPVIPPEPTKAPHETFQPEPEPIPATESPVQQASENIAPIPPSQRLPVQPAPGSPASGDLVLELEATQLTWVVVRSDDLAPHEALLQPGQRITWKASKQFLLTLGNAAGVVVKLNGETQGAFGKPGQVVRNILLKP